MKKITIEYISMLKRVLNYLFDPANVATTNSIPQFATVATATQANVATIDALLIERAEVITGLAALKHEARIALAQASFPIMSAVRSYAEAQGDPVLIDQMKTSLADLSYMKFALLSFTIGQAINVVSPLVGSLSNYNVTPAIFTNWQTVYANYVAALEGPQVAIAMRKALGTSIQTTVKETMTLVDGQLDTLASNFKDTQPLFYANYKNNRKLIHTATSHITPALRSYVRNEAGMPITDGEIFILGTDKSAVLDSKGHVFIEHVPAGAQMITLTTASGTHTYGPFNFQEPHILNLNFEVVSTSTEKAAVSVSTEKVEEVASEEN